jgi:hypothetical protein
LPGRSDQANVLCCVLALESERFDGSVVMLSADDAPPVDDPG